MQNDRTLRKIPDYALDEEKDRSVTEVVWWDIPPQMSGSSLRLVDRLKLY